MNFLPLRDVGVIIIVYSV